MDYLDQLFISILNSEDYKQSQKARDAYENLISALENMQPKISQKDMNNLIDNSIDVYAYELEAQGFKRGFALATKIMSECFKTKI